MKKNNFNKKNMEKFNTNKTSAFSLIEMAIAIILIALIIIGIIGGARIVKNARISSTISEMSNYSSDTNAFYDRFEQYPGDFNMASSMLVDSYGNIINDGNNDDLIGNTDFSEDESAGFFHHLRLAGIIPNTPFNGEAVSSAENVVIDENYPGTKFSKDTFYYVASDNIDGRYSKNNRIVIASTAGSVAGAMIPQDAESFDNKIDDGKPLTGKVIAHNTNTAMNDSSCISGGVGKFNYIETIPEAQYNTTSKLEDCILKKRLDGGEEVIAAPSCGATCAYWDPVDERYEDEDGNPYGSCTLAALPSTVNGKSITSWSGEVIHGSTATGVCDVATYESGSATATCSDGTWGSFAETCFEYSYADCPDDGEVGYPDEATYYVASWTQSGIAHGDTLTGVCDTGYEGDATNGVPVITCNDGTWNEAGVVGSCVSSYANCPDDGEVGYPDEATYNVASWTQTDNSDPLNGVMNEHGDTLVGTCDTNYEEDPTDGVPIITCNDGTWDEAGVVGECVVLSCVSDVCTAQSTYYCGDNWDCSGDTCCSNNITGGGVDTSLNNIVGDCYSNCSGTMGNDTISNAIMIFGDCNSNCSGIMGNDTISNASYAAFGDCQSSCSGIMGNDIIIVDTSSFVIGDCVNTCGGITSWGTDIFRITGSNVSFGIIDFNAGGIDDKIELPSGVSISITGSGYSRNLSYTGSYSGSFDIDCNSSENSCDASGSWAVKACNIYIGGVQQSSCTGCDAGTCIFND